MSEGRQVSSDARRSLIRIRSGRGGPLFLCCWQTGVVVVFAAFALSAALSSAVPAVAGAVVLLCVLVTSRWTGLFVADGQLRLRLWGITRWSAPITEVTAVSIEVAPDRRLNPRWVEPSRIELVCGTRRLHLPPDVLSRLWTVDPAAAVHAIVATLTEELRAAGATSLA